MSSHPFASSPRIRNGTGYGSRTGPKGSGPSGVALIWKYARSKVVDAARGVCDVDARGGAEPEVSVFAKLHHLVHPVVIPRSRRSEADGLLDGERLERGDGALDRGRASPDPLHHLPPVVVAEDGREEPLDARRGAVDARAQRVANVEIALAREEAPGLPARRGRPCPGEFQRGHGVGDVVRRCRGGPAVLETDSRRKRSNAGAHADVDASDASDDDDDDVTGRESPSGDAPTRNGRRAGAMDAMSPPRCAKRGCHDGGKRARAREVVDNFVE